MRNRLDCPPSPLIHPLPLPLPAPCSMPGRTHCHRRHPRLPGRACRPCWPRSSPTPGDTIVTLGRLRRSRAGLLRSAGNAHRAGQTDTNLVPLLGNHDEVMLAVCRGHTVLAGRTGCSSAATPRWPATASVDSGRGAFSRRSHLEFLDTLPADVRDRAAFLRSRQLRRGAALEQDAARSAALGIAQGPRARAARFRQDGHRGPHVRKKTAKSSTWAISAASTPGATATAGSPRWTSKTGRFGRPTK